MAGGRRSARRGSPDDASDPRDVPRPGRNRRSGKVDLAPRPRSGASASGPLGGGPKGTRGPSPRCARAIVRGRGPVDGSGVLHRRPTARRPGPRAGPRAARRGPSGPFVLLDARLPGERSPSARPSTPRGAAAIGDALAGPRPPSRPGPRGGGASPRRPGPSPWSARAEANPGAGGEGVPRARPVEPLARTRRTRSSPRAPPSGPRIPRAPGLLAAEAPDPKAKMISLAPVPSFQR